MPLRNIFGNFTNESDYIMRIQESDSRINIKFPKNLTEDNINPIKVELEAYDFKRKSEDFKLRNMNIVIDLSIVDNIDFFGYQHLYGFCYFIKRILNFNDFKIEKKSETFINFEKKYGLFI